MACMQRSIETWCVILNSAQSSSNNTSTCRQVTCQDAPHKMMSQVKQLNVTDNAMSKLLSAVLGSSQLHTHTAANSAKQALQADDMPILMTRLGSAFCAHSHKDSRCVVDQLYRLIVDQHCATPGWPFLHGSPVKSMTI